MTTQAMWSPLNAEFPTTPPPNLSVDSQGRHYLGFDAATIEYAVFTFVAPSGIDLTGNQTVRIYWRADTATTGNVIWRAEVEAITDGDATDTDAASSYAAPQSVTDAAPGTPAGRITVAEITLSVAQADAMAAGDLVRLRISRNATNASDTMAGDAEVLAVEWDDAAT